MEYSTGAGFGTAAISDNKAEDCIMFSIDISYACHGNTIGIAEYLGIGDTLFPVCANFWHSPFANQSTDVCCAHFGLDESRELPLVIGEIARILSKGGFFVNTSRTDGLFRQYDFFEPFGFTNEEAKELLKTARLYSDTDELINQCALHGLSLYDRQSFPPTPRKLTPSNNLLALPLYTQNKTSRKSRTLGKPGPF